MKVEPHSRFGRQQGWYIERDDGTKLYIAVRKMRERIRKHNAWAIDLMTLKNLQARGVELVGVRVQTKSKTRTWLTPLADFFDPTKSTYWQAELGCRAVALDQFRVSPGKDLDNIEKNMRLRR